MGFDEEAQVEAIAVLNAVEIAVVEFGEIFTGADITRGLRISTISIRAAI